MPTSRREFLTGVAASVLAVPTIAMGLSVSENTLSIVVGDGWTVNLPSASRLKVGTSFIITGFDVGGPTVIRCPPNETITLRQA